MLESVAVSEYQKYSTAIRQPNQPILTFMEWMKSCEVKLVNIPTSQQFWLKEHHGKFAVTNEMLGLLPKK